MEPDLAERPSTSYLDAGLHGDPSKRVELRASKRAIKQVKEGPKPLAEYMTLPASQYSVLDAKKVERLDEDTFRCYVGGISFFSFVVEPVLTLKVETKALGCDISMLACKLQGSRIVEAQNDKFASRMLNSVRWRAGSKEGTKELVADISIEVDLQVPGWFVLPNGTVRSTGNAVMNAVLEAAVPKFLEQLERDYGAWANGDSSRKPLGTGELDIGDVQV